MANENYINVGTALKINGEGDADYAWSMEGVSNGAGRVSAQIDLGAAPRPYRFKWTLEFQLQATPTQGAGVELYRSSAPDGTATRIDGDIGQSDAAMGDIDMRRNMKPIGFGTSENAAASEKCITSGVFDHYDRYLSFGGYNGSGAAINATDSNFIFTIQPVYNVPGA